MPIRVFKYGLLPPTEQAERVREQMRLAHKYRNTLTEIERARRASTREAMAQYGDVASLEVEVRRLDAECEAASRAVSEERKQTRSRAVSQDARERLNSARATRKDAFRLLREARTRLRDDDGAQRAFAEVNERAAQRVRDARAACGVHWGTYLLIEDAMTAARAAPMFDGAQPNDPRFVRWDGEGQVGVQLQGGMPASELFGDDTRLRIEEPDPRAWDSPVRGERRLYSRTTLWLRVGSEGRAPIWAKWPMVMHRPLPEGAVIKRTNVSLRRVGPRECWTCEVTAEIPEPAALAPKSAVVALDIGWRVMGDEIRVGAWVDHAGKRGEIRIPASLISSIRYPEHLRSIRDQNLNAARGALVAWMKEQPAALLPAWFAEATATLAQWRSPGRLAALVLRWRKERFEGDGQGYEPAEAWRYHDHHLWEWECSQRVKSLRHRREVYRVFAARLARAYGVLVLEDFDLRKVAAVPEPVAQGTSSDIPAARSNRQLAAVSELRMALIQAFAARGGRHETVPAEYSTLTCHKCGHVNDFDAAKSVEQSCSGCGASWDQDDNAAVVLMGRWRAKSSAPPPAAPGTPDGPKEARWAKVRRKGKERKDKGQPRAPAAEDSGSAAP